MAASEPFPILNTSADQLHTPSGDGAPRRRRKSSVIGSEFRIGDPDAKSRGGLVAADGASQTDAPRRLSKRRRARGLLSRFRHAIARHNCILPGCLLLTFLTLYAFNPTESNPIHHFIFLSYPEPTEPGKPQLYGKGYWDIAFVVFYTIVLTFTREFFMQEIFRPMARFAGLPRRKTPRFMEQAYTALYFGILGPAGMYVMSKTPVWYFNTRGMYEEFPHWYQEGIVKFYYLFQAAYWAQQAIVLILGMEKPRKDFRELVAHHIVSLSLIGCSYRFHFTYIGLAVYTTHDISDFFLATSKTLNYLDSPIVGPYYACFMGVWIYMRHYLNLKILYSLFTEFKTVGPYELDWAGGQFKCEISFWITLTLLSSLQALNLFWLYYIIRIALRFIRDKHATDERSDDEGEDDEPVEELLHKQAAEANGHTNGHANGYANGHANGHAVKSN